MQQESGRARCARNNFLFLLYTDFTKPTEPQHAVRRAMPSSPCHCHFDAAGGAYPPRRVIPVLVRQGGPVLSLSYRCSNFDAVRRAMPSSPCHLPLRCGGEGMPLPTMSFQFWCGREGTVPSLSYRSSNFDSVRRGMPPPRHVFVLTSMR